MAFFDKFPELEEIDAWLLANAPWVKGAFYFRFLGSWEFAADSQTRVEVTNA
jgi:hypothetical protein